MLPHIWQNVTNCGVVRKDHLVEENKKTILSLCRALQGKIKF